jgi:hypothetical protein
MLPRRTRRIAGRRRGRARDLVAQQARRSAVSRLACSVLLAALLAVAGGCQLPDIQPFADATIQVRTAAVTSGRAVNDDFRLAVERTDPAGRADLEQLQKDFRTAWQARDAALTAMVDYANALVEITSAAGSARDTIDGLATAVGELSKSAGIPLDPRNEAGSMIVDAAKFITAQIEVMVAQRALDGAMREAQPIIDRIAAKLVEDLDSMRRLSLDFAELERNHLASVYGDFNGYWQRLTSNILERDFTTGDPAELDRQTRLAQLVTAAEGSKLARDAAYASVEARLRAQLDLLGATSVACEAWAQTHSQIATAVQQSRRVDVQGLLSAGAELKDLIGRMRDL